MESILIVCALLALLFLRVPVAFALGSLGMVLLWLKGFPLIAVPQRLFGTMDSFELLAVPLFLLMSNVLLKGGVGRDLFASVQAWVGHWPGGLGVATIKSCTLFSAISGSSVATAATIGTVAIPEMEKRGFDRPFIMGQLAAGGTLGILIPPSIPLIIYGVITETSIPTLFLAGIGPGLFLATLFIIYAMIYSRGKKDLEEERMPFRQRLSVTLLALPTVVLAIAIIGSIYAGIATPSESAGVGFVIAMIMTFAMGRMDFVKLREAVNDALKTTAMIFIIVAGAKVFSYAITLYLIPQSISGFLTTHISNPTIFIFAVGLVLLFIGFFLESLSMLLIMVPVLFPALQEMGIDPIWFGIIVVVVTEISLITPPVGLNVFVLRAVVGDVPTATIFKGVTPFWMVDIIRLIILLTLPGLVLLLPNQM